MIFPHREEISAHLHSRFCEWVRYWLRVGDFNEDGSEWHLRKHHLQFLARIMNTSYFDLPPEDQARFRDEATKLVNFVDELTGEDLVNGGGTTP